MDKDSVYVIQTAEIPKGVLWENFYKLSALSLCRNCKFLDRDCSAIPLSIFKDRSGETYTSTCRDWKEVKDENH